MSIGWSRICRLAHSNRRVLIPRYLARRQRLLDLAQGLSGGAERGALRTALHRSSPPNPEECCAIIKCRQINRGAQNGSRTPLKMLILLRSALRRTPLGSLPRFVCEPMAKSDQPTTIKKYANRRLYNTGTSTYVTLEDLAAMVKEGEDFLVYDAKTGDDITRSVLAQIIFEQENKAGQNLLPTTFLRQLIRFYGDSMQMVVPKYLEQSIDTLTREQEKFRKQLASTFSGTPFAQLEEQVRRNMELFQQTFSMFKPFGARSGTADAASSDDDNIDDLRRQMREMQERLDRLSKEPKKEE